MENYGKHNKFYVAVDCVIFTYDEEELKILLYPRGFEPSIGRWSLMGGFVEPDKTLEDEAQKVLYNTVGLKDIYLEQVLAFSDPERDPGGRVISIAFYALMPYDYQDKELVRKHGAHWWPVNKLPDLIFDHKNMIDTALLKLQQKARIYLVGKEMLPRNFTLTQLHSLYNAIFQKKFDAGNFRKKILSLKVLKKLTIKDTSGSKRGAYYYTFKDETSYDHLERIIKN
jgi:ADP-ribose pyrophosphatase YjhB (NUDIX family)